MYEQLYDYLNNYLYDLLYGFRIQPSMFCPDFYFIGKRARKFRSGNNKILMDLSKAYNSLPHDHLIVKLEIYGLDKNSLNLVNGYLSFCKQKIKISTSYSD